VRVSTDQRATTECKGSHFKRDVILWAVRWYLAYPISDRQLEEMMNEHGVEVDLSTLNRWVLKDVPLLEQEFGARKQPVGPSWRMDETYVRVKAPGSRPRPNSRGTRRQIGFRQVLERIQGVEGPDFDERRASAESGALPIAACCGFGLQTSRDQRGNVNGAESEASSVPKKSPFRGICRFGSW
jgi:hypothetical protein